MTPVPAQRAGNVWDPLVLAASVAGHGHLHAGLPCQDAHGYEWLHDGTLVLALADGAGSARLADVGAGSAVAGAILAARDFAGQHAGDAALWVEGESGVRAVLGQRLRAALQGARDAVESAAQARGVSLRELASTLLVCLWTESGTVVGHVGDGAVVALRDESAGLHLLSGPAASEYANETSFLTDSNWGASVRTSALPGWVAGLVMMSDGCQRAALRRQPGAVGEGEPAAGIWEPFGPFLLPILRFAATVPDGSAGTAELQTLLLSDKLTAHSDDDKTLIVLHAGRWREGPGG